MFVSVLVNCEVSKLEEYFWVEKSYSVMEESNKISIRRYEFLFQFDLFIILSFCSCISILSFKTSFAYWLEVNNFNDFFMCLTNICSGFLSSDLFYFLMYIMI